MAAIARLWVNREGTITSMNNAATARWGACVGQRCSEIIAARVPLGAPHCTRSCARYIHADGGSRDAMVLVHGDLVRVVCRTAPGGCAVSLHDDYGYPVEDLDNRERAVLQLVACGETPRGVSVVLDLPVVEVHDALARAQLKLGAGSIFETAARAIAAGFIRPD